MPFSETLYHKANLALQSLATKKEPSRCPKRVHLFLHRYPVGRGGSLLYILDIAALEVRSEGYRAYF